MTKEATRAAEPTFLFPGAWTRGSGVAPADGAAGGTAVGVELGTDGERSGLASFLRRSADLASAVALRFCRRLLKRGVEA